MSVEFDEMLRLGAQFCARLAQSMCDVQPVRWTVLDTILVDWWYGDVIEPARWENEGGR